MEMLNINKFLDKYDREYDSNWKTLPETTRFICETIGYFMRYAEVPIEWVIDMAADVKNDFSDSIKKMNNKEIRKLLNEVIA